MNKKSLSVIAASTIAWWGCSHAELLGCLIEPDRVADVGSYTAGVIEKFTVERGDSVAAGQVVARLGAQVEKASQSISEAKSKAEAEALQAQAAYDLAQRKLERTRDLVKREFVSDQALDQAEAEARVALHRIEQAREGQRVLRRELNLSSIQLGQRDVRSPFAGLVVERYRTEGERIEHEPLVRVARIDPLRIEAIVPAPQFGLIKAGQLATIKTDLPNFAVLSATVMLVDKVVDPASNSFRVRLSMPNPGNRIPSGLRCRLAFDSVPPPAALKPAVVTPAVVTPAVLQLQPQPQTQQPVMVVLASMPQREPLRPKRYLSSTLKIAMAMLARTSPGARMADVGKLPDADTVIQPTVDRPKVMAGAPVLSPPILSGQRLASAR